MHSAPPLGRVATRAVILASILAVVSCTTPAPAGGPAPVSGPAVATDVRVNATRGTGTEDENIQPATAENVRGAAADVEGIPAGKAEGTTRSRGNYACAVHFDNRSGLIIHTYVDGKYTGAMGRYGDVYTYAVPGPTRLYARANYTDGSWDSWGPNVVNCPDGGSFTWRLHHSSR